MKRRMRTIVALAATVMCLASGLVGVMPVEAAKESCMHETVEVSYEILKECNSISENEHSEVCEQTFRCAICGKPMDGTKIVSRICAHTMHWSDLGHKASVTLHTYAKYCRCGYSQNVVLFCDGIVTGSHSHP